MIHVIESVIASLGLTKGSVLGGFVGALVSLKFIEGLSLWQRGTTVFAGMIVAAYVAPIVIHFMELKPTTEASVAFLIGLFGMSLCGAIVKAIPGLVDAVRDRIREGK